jgi:hypothetical protein
MRLLCFMSIIQGTWGNDHLQSKRCSMITEQELRLGNLVHDAVSKTYLKIESLSKDSIVASVIDRDKYPLADGWQMEPIPLTAEILQTCGFVSVTHRYHDGSTSQGWKRPNGPSRFFVTEFMPGKFAFWDFCGGLQSLIHTELTYLHQLQNLHFAITFKELEINL